LAATIETFGNIEEDRISEAFDRIDSDDDGYSTYYYCFIASFGQRLNVLRPFLRSNQLFNLFICGTIVSKKNLQEALGKDYTKERVEEIMRVSGADISQLSLFNFIPRYCSYRIIAYNFFTEIVLSSFYTTGVGHE
jgi:hypothetical protein